jgi:hypothetical protein
MTFWCDFVTIMENVMCDFVTNTEYFTCVFVTNALVDTYRTHDKVDFVKNMLMIMMKT